MPEAPALALRFKADWKIWSNPMPSKQARRQAGKQQVRTASTCRRRRAEERKNIYEQPGPSPALPASRITLFLNTQNSDGKAGPLCWSLLDFHDTRSHWQGRRGEGARQVQVRARGERSEWHPGLARCLVFVSPELPEENSFLSTTARLPSRALLVIAGSARRAFCHTPGQ